MIQAFAGLGMGILVGICLYLAKMLKYDEQVGSMIFKRMTLLKFYMGAQLTSLLSLTALRLLGVIDVSFSAFNWLNAILGGLVFGFGWGILGYCPGTCSGAIGTGKVDGIFGALGIMVGSLLFAVCYPAFTSYSKNLVVTKVGVSDPFWLCILSLAIAFLYLLIFRAFERHDL